MADFRGRVQRPHADLPRFPWPHPNETRRSRYSFLLRFATTLLMVAIVLVGAGLAYLAVALVGAPRKSGPYPTIQVQTF